MQLVINSIVTGRFLLDLQNYNKQVIGGASDGPDTLAEQLSFAMPPTPIVTRTEAVV